MRPSTPSHLTTLPRKTDDWFRRANATLLSQVPCHAGCSRCCVGVFPITRFDVRLLQEGLANLPEDQRNQIAARAAQQITEITIAYPRLQTSASLDGWSDQDIDSVVTAFHDTPCPALSESGLCSLYAHRPLTCRSMGIPMREGPMVTGACEVQTTVPIVRLSSALVAEEQALAVLESVALAALPETATEGEEVLLPYGFIPDGNERKANDVPADRREKDR
jgi:Fe-S-cluster containining protein